MAASAGPNKFTGDHTARVPPVPIPNTEVKPRWADGTARAGAWEIRRSPVIAEKKARYGGLSSLLRVISSGQLPLEVESKHIMHLPRFVLYAAMFAVGAGFIRQPVVQAQTGVRSSAHKGPLSPDEELGNLTRSLQLTDDQQSHLRPVLVGRREQLAQIHNDRTLSREGKSAKMKALDDNANQKVLALLTPEQKTKYQAMIERRRAALARQRAGRAE